MSNVIRLDDERKKRRKRRPITVDACSLRIAFARDGGFEIHAHACVDGQWGDISWPVSAEQAQRIEEGIRQTRAASQALAALAASAGASAPGPAAKPKRRRCKLTPEGYLGVRRGIGCRRHRGHDGDHFDGTSHYQLKCPHFGMFRLDGKPTATTCPWCHVALLPRPSKLRDEHHE